MGIEQLKRWHWIIIGAVVGVLLAFIQVSIGTDNLVAGGQHSSISQEIFERALDEPPVRGHAVVENIRVFPDGAKYLVKIRYLSRDPKNPKDGRLRKYEESVLTTGVPFAPLHDISKTIDVRILPAYADARTGKTISVVKINGSERTVAAQFSGWTPAGVMFAEPDAAGAEVKFELNRASYVLQLYAPDASATAIAQATLSLNDKSLPALAPAPANASDAGVATPSRGMWQTTVPAALLAAKQQTLRVARGSEPLRIREIRLFNPNYTIVNYLKDRQAANKLSGFRFAWWTQTRGAFIVWTMGSIVLIGGIWPTVLQLLTRAGFGAQPQDPAYDLSRFKSASSAKPKGPVVVTEQDQQRLAALGAEMEAKLRRDASAAAPVVANVAAAPVPVKQLNAEPVAAPAAPLESETTREFKAEGEFYPVVRNVVQSKPLDSEIDKRRGPGAEPAKDDHD